MKCDLCGKKEAIIHLTEVVNDQVSKLHICEACARQKNEQMQSHFGLTDLLSGLVDLGEDYPDERISRPVSAACPACGAVYHDFQKTGRLGCGKCYDVFAKPLSDLLRKIHGADRHVGKMPFKGKNTPEVYENLRRLKNELNVLVASEEFEKAAVLRDRIKAMESGTSKKGTGG